MFLKLSVVTEVTYKSRKAGSKEGWLNNCPSSTFEYIDNYAHFGVHTFVTFQSIWILSRVHPSIHLLIYLVTQSISQTTIMIHDTSSSFLSQTIRSQFASCSILLSSTDSQEFGYGQHVEPISCRQFPHTNVALRALHIIHLCWFSGASWPSLRERSSTSAECTLFRFHPECLPYLICLELVCLPMLSL